MEGLQWWKFTDEELEEFYGCTRVVSRFWKRHGNFGLAKMWRQLEVECVTELSRRDLTARQAEARRNGVQLTLVDSPFNSPPS